MCFCSCFLLFFVSLSMHAYIFFCAPLGMLNMCALRLFCIKNAPACWILPFVSYNMLMGNCFTVIISAWDGLYSHTAVFIITFVPVNSIGQWLHWSRPKYVIIGNATSMFYFGCNRANFVREKMANSSKNVCTTCKIDANNSQPQINPNQIMTTIIKTWKFNSPPSGCSFNSSAHRGAFMFIKCVFLYDVHFNGVMVLT